MTDDEPVHAMDVYERHRKEGQRLHDFGQYNQAIEAYQRARAVRPEPSLILAIVSSRLCQGRLLEAISEMERAGDIDGLAPENDATNVGLKMAKAFTTSLATMKLSSQLESVTELYQAHLAPRMPHSIGKPQAAQLSLYLGFRNLAKLVGANVEPPPLPLLSDVIEVYQHLMHDGHYSTALTLLTIRGNFTRPEQYANDLEVYTAHHGLPDIDRAYGLHEMAVVLMARGSYRAAETTLNTADSLFKTEGYVVASLILSVDRCELDFKLRKDNRKVAETLWSLKDELQAHDHIEGVRKALSLLYEVALELRDTSMRAQIDEDYQANAKERGRIADWYSQRYSISLQWSSFASTTLHEIETLEALYTNLEPTDYNILKAKICGTLVERHQELGNEAEVSVWNARLAATQIWIPGSIRFTLGQDKYFNRAQKSVLDNYDPDEDLAELQFEINKLLDQLSAPDILPGQRWAAVLKIPNLANHFMNKYAARGVCQTEKLVQICVASKDALSKELLPSQRKHLAANLQSCANRMLYLKAHLYDDPDGGVSSLQPVDQECMQEVLRGDEDVEAMYREAGSPVDVACTQRMAALAYQELWTIGKAGNASEVFAKATLKNGHAHRVFKSYEVRELRRTAAIEAAKLLLQGFYSQVGYAKTRLLWRWLGADLLADLMARIGVFRYLALPASLSWIKKWFARNALDEASDYLVDFAAIIDQERQNLSTLGDKQSILAKQRLGQRSDNTAAATLGVEVYRGLNDATKLWCWIQRCKARSISDLLGLGINMPMHIEQQLDHNATLRQLRDQERELVNKISNADGTQSEDRLLLWAKLENHRKKMRAHGPLRELLDIAEGTAVQPNQLFALPSLVSQPRRKTWYVDWTVVNGLVCIMAISEGCQTYFDKVMRLADALTWLKDNIQLGEDALCLGSEDDGMKALAGLRPMIAPLLSLTNEGDLLVFCLTNPLHGMPIHAALIEEFDERKDPNKQRVLIERNPIVYTFSMTTFHQCTMRSFKSASPTKRAKDTGVVLSVYEDTDQGKALESQEPEQLKVYKLSADISKQNNWRPPQCGHDLTKRNFALACDANIVHFSGHFMSASQTTSQNVLESGLLLGRADAAEQDNSGGHPTDSVDTTTSTSGIHSRIFSVEDIFDQSFQVPTSHFTLVACGSASSYTTKGDESLGFVSALLCRGANSVLATQWKIASVSGRAFTKRFYKKFHKDTTTSIDLAFALQQTIKEIRSKESDLQAPYFWAGYALYGTWHYRPQPLRDDSKAER